MVISTFFLLDKDNKERFFEEIFLLVDISLHIIFGMLFFTMNNADVDFQGHSLQ